MLLCPLLFFVVLSLCSSVLLCTLLFFSVLLYSSDPFRSPPFFSSVLLLYYPFCPLVCPLVCPRLSPSVLVCPRLPSSQYYCSLSSLALLALDIGYGQRISGLLVGFSDQLAYCIRHLLRQRVSTNRLCITDSTLTETSRARRQHGHGSDIRAILRFS